MGIGKSMRKYALLCCDLFVHIRYCINLVCMAGAPAEESSIDIDSIDIDSHIIDNSKLRSHIEL